MTALRVSQATGIARTTIYRHWPEREDLLRETVAMDEPDSHIALTGNTRADLIAMLGHMAEQVGKRRSARMMAVAFERAGYRGRAGGPHREMVRKRMEPLRKIVESGIAQGDLAATLDADAAVAQLAGPAFFRAVLMRQKVTADFVADTVDAFMAAHSA